MKKKLVCYIFLGLLCLLLSACGAQLEEGSIDDYAAARIAIYGLTEQDLSVSVAELAQLPTVKRSASANRANGEKVAIDAVGPLLEELLQLYGHSQTDFDRIRFVAGDGYAITVDAAVLQNREIILALSDGGQALPQQDQPLRVVIPGERAMYWVRHLSSISLESGAAPLSCRRLMLLETLAPRLTAVDYQYNGSNDRAVSLAQLFAAAECQLSDDTLLGFSASDGLDKTHNWSDISTALLKYNGADAPRLVGEQLPAGMQIYNLLYLSCDELRLLSLEQALALWGAEGEIGFFQLCAKLSMVSSENYRLSFDCGTVSSYSVDQLSGAVLRCDAQGRVELFLADQTACSGLLSVEAQ